MTANKYRSKHLYVSRRCGNDRVRLSHIHLHSTSAHAPNASNIRVLEFGALMSPVKWTYLLPRAVFIPVDSE